MRNMFVQAVAASILGGLLSACSQPPTPKPPSTLPIVPLAPETVRTLLEKRSTSNFVPGEVVVRRKPLSSGSRPLPAAVLQRLNLEIKTEQTSGGEIIYQLPVALRESLSATELRQRTLAIAKNLQTRSDVAYAQPNYLFQISMRPNDSYFPKQWSFLDNGNDPSQSSGGINLPLAWTANRGSNAVVVAVLDTGILPAHEDIQGSPNLINGYDMISDVDIANDGDGRDADPADPGDAIGAGECYAQSPALPNSWHGTHVAGIIGVGKTNNNLGVAGINWNVKVQPIRVLGKCGGTMTDINDAIRWAAGLSVPGVPANPTPAKIINLGLASNSPCSVSPAMQSAINDALAKGVTVIAAAGNEASDVAQFMPASCNGVIAVAASDRRGYLATRYSNYGKRVDILAPGGDIRQDVDNDGDPDGVLSMIDGGYAFYNGTSMAAAHVTGVAALLLAQDNRRTPAQLLSLIKSKALPRTAVQCPKPCGAGLLNANFNSAPVTTSVGVQISIMPEPIRLPMGESQVVTATVTRDGNAESGKAISFVSSDLAAARVLPASTMTDANGVASATITGVASGEAVLRIESQDARVTAPIDVTLKLPAVSLWILSPLAVLALLGYLRGLRRPRRPGGP